VARHGEAPPLVRRGDEAEQQLAADRIERGEAELVDDEQVRAQERVQDPADAVVGLPPVERFDELDPGEVPDPQAGGDRGMPERREQIGCSRCPPITP
jgi:hypothetical protein